MYDARHIANWFVERAAQDHRQLTIMQLLKLVYIAHGWHLEMRKSPLIINKIEAWKYGPVIPDIYNSFRSKGVTINEPIPFPPAHISAADEHLLNEIYRIYGSMSAATLSDITHEVNGPWDQATRTRGYFAPIPNELIKAHYEQKRAT
ncbi:MAG: Panacea domain-containing protein [Allorhizobium sp.]